MSECIFECFEVEVDSLISQKHEVSWLFFRLKGFQTWFFRLCYRWLHYLPMLILIFIVLVCFFFNLAFYPCDKQGHCNRVLFSPVDNFVYIFQHACSTHSCSMCVNCYYHCASQFFLRFLWYFSKKFLTLSLSFYFLSA